MKFVPSGARSSNGCENQRACSGVEFVVSAIAIGSLGATRRRQFPVIQRPGCWTTAGMDGVTGWQGAFWASPPTPRRRKDDWQARIWNGLLTEKEVISAIQSRLQSHDAPDQVKRVYLRIMRTRRLSVCACRQRPTGERICRPGSQGAIFDGCNLYDVRIFQCD